MSSFSETLSKNLSGWTKENNNNFVWDSSPRSVLGSFEISSLCYTPGVIWCKFHIGGIMPERRMDIMSDLQEIKILCILA
jgi:hypothetical protein